MKTLLTAISALGLFLCGCASPYTPLMAERDMEQIVRGSDWYKKLSPGDQNYVIQKMRLEALQAQMAENNAKRQAFILGVAQGLNEMGDSIEQSSHYQPIQTTTVFHNGYGQPDNVMGAHNGTFFPDGQGGGTYWGN